MKIYTKTGDKGETSLYGGKRVRKDNARVEAYGDIDETNAAIGIARSYIHEGSSGSREALGFIDSALETVQNKLFSIGATLAGSEDQSYFVKDSDIEYLEKCIDHIDELIPPVKAFILPFGTDLCARLHFARTVSRRTERKLVALSAIEQVDPNILAYSNRLSDFLFTLARFANKAQSVPDTLWKKEHQPQIQVQAQSKLDLKPETHLAEQKPNLPAKVASNGTKGQV
ncbi:MAG: cob(I)yrinic acid a,c-diamide adenosyltransferase [Nitrososphaerota archaeon]|nr:cob(I)yrinic acid a,c-diamide adenosyltransferase [Nitrososphaerota archaeon]